MRNPTPVTTRIMREDKGSTCKPASDLKEPDSIQLNSCFSKRLASGGRRRSPINTSIEIKKDRPITPQATYPTVSFRSLLPINPLMAVPINGNNKINATRLSILHPNPTMSEPKRFYFFKSVPLNKGGSKGLCFCLNENYSQPPSSPFPKGDFYASCYPKTRLNENPFQSSLTKHYHFMIFISSMFTVSLFLNTATIIARPTAASAAATVMVKNTNNWPCMELR